MRTSATGRAEGFTLLEVLVVLVILGIGVSLVALNLSRAPEALLEEETRRLAALLQHARDEAIVTGRSLAWRAHPAGYEFAAREPSRGWIALEGDPALRPRAWPPDIAVAEVRIGGVRVAPDAPVMFASSGINPPFHLVLASGEQRRTLSTNEAGVIRLER